APTQPSKFISPLAINLDPIELLFSTPPTSPQAFLDSLKDFPPITTNPPPPRPSFDTIERRANEPPPILPIDSSFPSPTSDMEPPIPPFPPQCSPNLPSNFPPLPPLGPNNPFPMLTHEMFCTHKARGSDSEDDNDDDDNANDDYSRNEDDDGNDAHDSERTDSGDDDENPSFTLKDYDEEEHDEEHESDDDNEYVYEEEDDDLYKDVNVRSLGVEHEKERKVVDEVAFIMNVRNFQEESSTHAPSLFIMPKTAILETSTSQATIIPPTISMITPLPQLMTPSPAPATIPTTTSNPTLPDFASLFRFNQRVSTLETKLSQIKQAGLSAHVIEYVKSQLPTMVDDLLSTRIGYATRIALQSYTKEFEKKAQEERKLL
ncbi:hypothetical protein Tco_1374451, partial [Tanacetum coccineum]